MGRRRECQDSLADALRQNLRAVELARVTLESDSKDLNALQEDLLSGQTYATN